MKYSAGDIVDRFTIVLLKLLRIGDSFMPEFNAYSEAITRLDCMHPEVPWLTLTMEMFKVNKDIWDLESDVRKGKLDGNLEEVGRRAIAIRDKNNKRIEIKNQIAELMGEFKEVKKDHASE